MRRLRIGIDIGSSKTTIIVGELYETGEETRILGSKIIPSKGILKGKILDAGQFVKALTQGKKELESELKVVLKEASVSISGTDIKSITTDVEYQLPGSENETTLITKEHCEKIYKIAYEKVAKESEETLRKEIYNYRVDNSGIMKDPIGKEGKILEGRVHLVTIPKERLTRVITALNKAGFSVSSVQYSGEASSKAVLTEKDKKNGVALVDIGHNLIEVTIYKNQKLISTSVIPLGGNHYRSDLQYIFEEELSVCEELIKKLRTKTIGDKIVVNYPKGTTMKTKSFDVKEVSEILDARSGEIIQYIMRGIQSSGYQNYLKNGIVVVGGTARKFDLIEKLKATMEQEVRVGEVLKIKGMTDDLVEPSAAAGVGILISALEDEYNNLLMEEEKNEKKEEIKEVKKEVEKPKKEIKIKKEKNTMKGIFSSIKKKITEFI